MSRSEPEGIQGVTNRLIDVLRGARVQKRPAAAPTHGKAPKVSKKSSDQEDEDEDEDPVPTPTRRLLPSKTGTKTPEKTKSQCPASKRPEDDNTDKKTKSQRPASKTPTPGIKDKKTRSQRPASKKTPARKPITMENDGPAFPGVPTKKVGPMQLERMAIYTDMNTQKWRVKRHGERKDKAFSFKSVAAGNWDKLRVYVLGG